MAKAKTAVAPKKVKKAAKAVKAVAKTAPKGAKKKKDGKKTKGAADALWKLAEHPLVGELLAIGATAAVAAIAEKGLGKDKKKTASSRAVKEAGKAAAAAIGARLISEFAEGTAKKAKSAKA